MEPFDQARRAADNQALFRDVNNRIQALNELFDAVTPQGRWACECARVECIDQISMTLAEYEALREHPARFAVLPDEAHVVPEVELVVERTDRYWIVEKIGEGAERARPRADSPTGAAS